MSDSIGVLIARLRDYKRCTDGDIDRAADELELLDRELEKIKALVGVADPAAAVKRWKAIELAAIAVQQAVGLKDDEEAFDATQRTVKHLVETLALPGSIK